MCECGASLCDRRVAISASEYDGLDDEPLLADAHHAPDGALGDCPRCGGRQRRERRRRR
jgi:hypothetical protein